MNNVEDKIQEKLDFFVHKFNDGDAAGLVNGFFTDNCIVTGSDVPLLIGREAATGVFSQLLEVQKNLSFEMLEYRESDGGLHYAVVQTRTKLVSDDSDLALKSLAVFRETSQGLLCEVDFFAAGAF